MLESDCRNAACTAWQCSGVVKQISLLCRLYLKVLFLGPMCYVWGNGIVFKMVCCAWYDCALFGTGVLWHAGVGSALGGDAVELLETGSLTAAVDQAMVSEPQDQEISGNLQAEGYHRPQGVSGGSPVSDEGLADFATVQAGLSTIGLRETPSD